MKYSPICCNYSSLSTLVIRRRHQKLISLKSYPSPCPSSLCVCVCFFDVIIIMFLSSLKMLRQIRQTTSTLLLYDLSNIWRKRKSFPIHKYFPTHLHLPLNTPMLYGIPSTKFCLLLDDTQSEAPDSVFGKM